MPYTDKQRALKIAQLTRRLQRIEQELRTLAEPDDKAPAYFKRRDRIFRYVYELLKNWQRDVRDGNPRLAVYCAYCRDLRDETGTCPHCGVIYRLDSTPAEAIRPVRSTPTMRYVLSAMTQGAALHRGPGGANVMLSWTQGLGSEWVTDSTLVRLLDVGWIMPSLRHPGGYELTRQGLTTAWTYCLAENQTAPQPAF